jgi:peptidyl-prolyl cis-trans isomerase A (cyclophilin A)
MRRALALLAAGFLAACSSAQKDLETRDLPGMSGPDSAGTYAVLETSRGEITIRLFPQDAPLAVANFVGLAKGEKEWTEPRTGKKTKRPLYDGTLFHRVVPGFMVQGGDPTGRGNGGPGFAFADEITEGRTFGKAGVVAMANTGPDSNGSQFFITVARTPWLDKRHTIFGEVVRGLEVAHAIAASPRSGEDRPYEDQLLKKVRIEEKK